MVSILDLWLPVLLSGVAVFFLSFMMWMVLPHHRSDYAPLPDEDGTMDSLRALGVKTGQYNFPHCSDPQQMKDPAWTKKYEQGPSGVIIVCPTGPVSMGGSMAVSFSYNVVVSVLVAYVATIALTTAASGMDVFRMTAVTSLLAYSGALIWDAIWLSRSWSSTWKGIFDGVVYGAATGALFMALWPVA